MDRDEVIIVRGAEVYHLRFRDDDTFQRWLKTASSFQAQEQLVKVGNIEFDRNRWRFIYRGLDVTDRLNGRPGELLSYLMRSPGTCYTVDELYRAVWRASSSHGAEAIIKTTIHRIRKVTDYTLIQTVPTKGYRLHPEAM